MSELKPCPVPWCTYSCPKLSQRGGHLYRVRCNECQTETPVFHTEHEAEECWNTRTPSTREKVLVEALEQALDDMGDDDFCVCPAAKEKMLAALSHTGEGEEAAPAPILKSPS